MDELLRNLLDSLDAIGEEHEEIYDTECREMMGEPIFDLFIKPTEAYQMPDEFGLFSSEANQQVKLALAQYIDAAVDCARQEGLTSFHQRLAAFQNGNVKSNLEGNFFDDFFGWMDPGTFDDEGNVIEQP